MAVKNLFTVHSFEGGGSLLDFLVEYAKKGNKASPRPLGYYIKDLDLFSELDHLPGVR